MVSRFHRRLKVKSRSIFLMLFGLICSNANADSSFTCKVLDVTSAFSNLSSTESLVMKTLVFPEDGHKEIPIDLSGTSMALNRVNISISGVINGNRDLTISWKQPNGSLVSVTADVKTGKVATGRVRIDQDPLKISCNPTHTIPSDVLESWEQYWKSRQK